MSYEERKGTDESSKVDDKSVKRHKEGTKKKKKKQKEALISARDADLPTSGKKKIKPEFDESESPQEDRRYTDKDYWKPSPSPYGYEGEKGFTKPFIEVIEETPSIKGGLTGMNTPTAPPLISKASLRRFSDQSYEGLQENRLTNAAKELKDAAWQRAVEMKDSTLQYAGRLTDTVQRKYNIPLSQWLPASFAKPTGLSTWEMYGKKKKQCMCLYEQAEFKLREARTAPPERARELNHEASVLKQKALRKAIKAQQLADKMKMKIDGQVTQLSRTTSPETQERKMTAWELYGHTKGKASKLHARAEIKEQEARQTEDRAHAAELLEEAARLRKKALGMAEEAQAYADGIKRAADDKVVEIRKWAMQNDSMPGAASVSSGASTAQPRKSSVPIEVVQF